MAKAIQIVFNEISKNVQKSPGWVPFLIINYIVFSFFIKFKLPIQYEDVGRNIIVLVITFLAYQIGDGLDKVFYKNYCQHKGGIKQDLVKEELGIKKGTYRIAKKLTEQIHTITNARKEDLRISKEIEFFNQFAKFCRSFGVLCFILIILIFFNQFAKFIISNFSLFKVSVIIVLFLVGVDLILLGLYLKMYHHKKLYKHINRFKQYKEYYDYELNKEIKLFFWDGTLIGSGKINND